MKIASYLLSISILAQPLQATVQFTREEVIKGSVVHSAQTIDYNNDGLQDLVYSADHGMHLALAPDFKPIQVAQRTKYRSASIHSMVMDVDSDGDLDFVVSDQGVVWYENPSAKNPETKWKKTWITKDITGHHCFISHDVDQDGKLDIVTNNFFPKDHFKDKKVRYPNLYPDSVAWFSVPSEPSKTESWKANLIADGDASGGSHYLGFADLDGDGKTEMLQGSKGEPFENGHYFAYWKRTKDVKAPWKRHNVPGKHVGATHLYGADFNGDGQMDMVGSKGHGTGISLFLGPDWREQKVNETLKMPHAFTTADIDQDGDVDLFACAKGSKIASWFENDSKGHFTEHILSDNQEAYDIFIQDLENDGDLDIVIAGQRSKNIVFYRQN